MIVAFMIYSDFSPEGASYPINPQPHQMEALNIDNIHSINIS